VAPILRRCLNFRPAASYEWSGMPSRRKGRKAPHWIGMGGQGAPIALARYLSHKRGANRGAGSEKVVWARNYFPRAKETPPCRQV